MELSECIEALRDAGVEASCIIVTSGGGDWIKFAVPIVLALGTIIGLLQLRALKSSSRMRATLDILNYTAVDTGWRDERLDFIKLRDANDGLKKYASDKDLRNSADAITILSQINFYELMALGIRHGILDESMYKEYYRGTLIKDYDAAREFIDIERGENKKFWVLFEEMAIRWKDPKPSS